MDLNNNSNLSTNNNNSIPGASSQQQQHSTHLGQYQSHLGQQQNSLVNAYSFLNNPYLNGGLLNSNGQGQLSAQNQAQLLSNFYNGNNLANFNLQPNALPPHLSNQSHAPSLHSTGILNMGNPASLLNASQLVGAFSDEHQAYEYLHQLLEEKEKLKELFNEPFNIMLPISAKLLDEGKYNKKLLDIQNDKMQSWIGNNIWDSMKSADSLCRYFLLISWPLVKPD